MPVLQQLQVELGMVLIRQCKQPYQHMQWVRIKVIDRPPMIIIKARVNLQIILRTILQLIVKMHCMGAHVELTYSSLMIACYHYSQIITALVNKILASKN